MRSSNVGKIPTIEIDRATEWACYDAMPACLRRLIQAAPYEYALLALSRQFAHAAAALGEAGALRQLASRMAQDRRRFAARLYGPDHPQAAA